MIYSVEHVQSACHILGIVCEAFMASIVASWLLGVHCKAADLSGDFLCWVLGRILKSTNISKDTVLVFCTCIKKVHVLRYKIFSLCW